ncbi:CLUMA_CG002613, isoform A [Clunio marinus]|uniref:CLUMA_CG002613, isoform A n=1 Tax=Clunio marinus TaxID=568069 RepID=A0A1J1HRF8_9DIPT|nr:CLUMA_CG002613, isoform A [Clunio marinus]
MVLNFSGSNVILCIFCKGLILNSSEFRQLKKKSSQTLVKVKSRVRQFKKKSPGRLPEWLGNLPDEERRLMVEGDQQVLQMPDVSTTVLNDQLASLGLLNHEESQQIPPIAEIPIQLQNQGASVTQQPYLHRTVQVNNQPITVNHHYHFVPTEIFLQQQLLQDIQRTMTSIFPLYHLNVRINWDFIQIIDAQAITLNLNDNNG